jgi:small subunit ribosomal protein S4e
MMPKSWPVAVKKETFVIRPNPGPHPLKRCMPLQLVVRDVLGLVETAAEARQILNAGKVQVDKKTRKNKKFPVGLMDIIAISGTRKHYLVNVNKKGIFLDEIKADEADHKLCMITGKKTLKKGVEQLNLHDGRNLILDKDSKGKGYEVHDSITIILPSQKIVRHHKLEKGKHAFIFSGKNIGAKGTIKEIKKRKSMTEKSTVTIKSKDKDIETLLDYVFVGNAGGKS